MLENGGRMGASGDVILRFLERNSCSQCRMIILSSFKTEKNVADRK